MARASSRKIIYWAADIEMSNGKRAWNRNRAILRIWLILVKSPVIAQAVRYQNRELQKPFIIGAGSL